LKIKSKKNKQMSILNLVVYDHNMSTPTPNRKYKNISEPREFLVNIEIVGDNLYLGSDWRAWDNASYNHYEEEESFLEVDDSCTYIIDPSDWCFFPEVIKNKYVHLFDIKSLKTKYPDWAYLSLDLN
jgi:hypothetical protein